MTSHTTTVRGLWALDPQNEPLAPSPDALAAPTLVDTPPVDPDRPWWGKYPFADGVWHPVRPLAVIKKRRNSAVCESCHNAPAYWLIFAYDHPTSPAKWIAAYLVCHSCGPPEAMTRDWKPWPDPNGGDR